MNFKDKNAIFCALDMKDTDLAVSFTKSILDYIDGVKIGMEDFYSMGIDGYNRIQDLKLPIFLDLKLHDIPNTVNSAIKSLLPLEPFMLNNIAYLLSEPTSIESIFGEDDFILAVADDQGHYYIPNYGLNTIDESGGMMPGKGYQVMISGSESVEFTYDEADDAGLGRSLAVVGISDNYEITRTGVS